VRYLEVSLPERVVFIVDWEGAEADARGSRGCPRKLFHPSWCASRDLHVEVLGLVPRLRARGRVAVVYVERVAVRILEDRLDANAAVDRLAPELDAA
jgi:hypothetical protein